ncbi:hypothetical protein GCM10023258_12610 [Terrabacter aeriphilus]|uniref:Uncharacterized protein n=1 Tax=Terrabacter aeriphilus TaxID=515662 RepID=A0ABP9J8V7_9MICO
MSDPTPMSDLVADDLLLDRLAGRFDAGAEPVAQLLSALAGHADAPLPGRSPRRRIGRRHHRYLGAFAALAVGASGAGVAAAVGLPDAVLDRVEHSPVGRPHEPSERGARPGPDAAGTGAGAGADTRPTAPVEQQGGRLLVDAGPGSPVVLVPVPGATLAVTPEAPPHRLPGVAAEPEKLAKAEKPAKGDKPSKPEKPARPGKPEKPAKPAKPEKPAKPAKPAKPEKPGSGEPGTSGGPSEPGEATRRAVPGVPAEPATPEKPRPAEKPAKPTEPEKPAKPTKPTEPEKPAKPTKPTEPEKPAKPAEPGHPTGPGGSSGSTHARPGATSS